MPERPPPTEEPTTDPLMTDEPAMSRRKLAGEIVGSVVIVAVGLILLMQMFGKQSILVKDPLTPWGLPRILAGILIALGVWLFPWKETFRRIRSDRPPGGGDDAAVESGTLAENLRVYLPLAGIVVYAALIPRLGFVVATTALGWVMLPVMGASKRRVIVIVPPATALLLWYVFGELLRVNLPSGIFF